MLATAPHIEKTTRDRHITEAMAKARTAQEKWVRTTLSHRRKLLKGLRHLLAENCYSLAEASASMRSRPVAESIAAEVVPLLEAVRFLERNLERVLASEHIGRKHRPIWLMGVTSTIVREPLGVVLIIGPGNYPLLLPGIQLLQAVAAGNAVMLKPGVGGSSAAKQLTALMQKAGFDKDLCIVLDESVHAAVNAIDARPAKVVFTGSSSTGKVIERQLAEHGIPSVMELSGCDAVIIREDADLELAASALAFGLTINDGHTCMAPRRAFVHRKVAKQFEKLLQERLRERLSSGAYFTGQQLLLSSTLRKLVKQAIDDGAHLVFGQIDSEVAEREYPIVVSRVDATAELLQVDHFASMLVMVDVDSDETAIRLVNRHELGLGASIFTKDLNAADQIARRLEVGMITINEVIIPSADPRLPLSGRKSSGFGATQGSEGLLEMTVAKVISNNSSKVRRAYDAPRKGDASLLTALTQAMHARGVIARFNALKQVMHEAVKYKTQ